MAGATRRGLLALVPAVAALPAASAAPDPDAELLRLGARFDVLAAEEQRLWRIADWRHYGGPPVDEATAEAAGVQAEAAMVRTGRVVFLIEQRQAHTLPGLLVKMRCLLWCHAGEFGRQPGAGIASLLNPNSNPDPASDVRLASAILRDLVAMG